ncbi:hypothetical protein BT63DRAFT_418532 [Microthyrium microscopicum]|uniref:Uncharacterized protein n=1 Tax=Microthyrium microscopicum TaxID=703497 RepID=A0A6A6TU81_9PEZI|nr:hypothetical protein BT63DRAFT_418532 [Microthyrium microscopicum]
MNGRIARLEEEAKQAEEERLAALTSQRMTIDPATASPHIPRTRCMTLVHTPRMSNGSLGPIQQSDLPANRTSEGQQGDGEAQAFQYQSSQPQPFRSEPIPQQPIQQPNPVSTTPLQLAGMTQQQLLELHFSGQQFPPLHTPSYAMQQMGSISNLRRLYEAEISRLSILQGTMQPDSTLQAPPRYVYPYPSNIDGYPAVREHPSLARNSDNRPSNVLSRRIQRAWEYDYDEEDDSGPDAPLSRPRRKKKRGSE